MHYEVRWESYSEDYGSWSWSSLKRSTRESADSFVEDLKTRRGDKVRNVRVVEK